MNLKVALGIFVPAALIVVLAIISTVEGGIIVSTDTVESVSFDDLFTAQPINLNNPVQQYTINSVPIQTITIQNDFALPRKYVLPHVFACLHDKETGKNRDVQAAYSQGEYQYGPRGDIVPLFTNRYSRRQRSIELPINGKEVVSVSIQQQYSWENEQTAQSYDEILLFERNENNKYYSCSSTSLGSASVRIPIVSQ